MEHICTAMMYSYGCSIIPKHQLTRLMRVPGVWWVWSSVNPPALCFEHPKQSNNTI